ncbi:HIT domain-containing protein [Thalassotalea piscium]|uniref:Diadenosine tetraphosphate (Ap4A) HIT family hydrolase n=1 Tax=Thalassotalea piscium TaxID=1230533 RepID=A0A7X0NH17_9GAMM|nr:HIT domain-containing protein [Thalassotalea piscium]MBB6543326.1 diadenosine tetraphosphate (Ap4A) HIT family hydrolase [Thalassotalea piscium]
MEAVFKLDPMLKRDCFELLELKLSKLLLMNDSQYPWFILVPKRTGIEDIYQLDWQDQQQLLNESSALSEILMQAFTGRKMNVAALGNMCSQLHVHHVVRFENDCAWPKPVWGYSPAIAYTEYEINALKTKLLPPLKKVLMPEC